MNSRKREYLLYIAIIFLLMAQYVGLAGPGFRWMALLTLVGVVGLEIVRRFSRTGR